MVSNTLKIAEDSSMPYPKSVAFIISNEFCERFNFYGMRTILVLYLTRRLNYDDDTATILYHVFTSLVYFFPLFGAVLADSWLGRFRTILYLSAVYCIGTVIISIGAIPPLNLPANLVTIIGLLLIAIGTGGIKPCVSAFGGDQFKIPEQAKQLATFFSLFYFAINAGSLISTSITPILREDVHCFNENDCFSLAFGVPGILMILSIIIFVVGKSLYTITQPSGNMIVSVSKCIVNAISTRSHEKRNESKEHWLDYAIPKHGKKLVDDTKALLKILVLYLPLPVFWALFDQQGSRWTFQATRMVGDVGGFTIKPDQMQVINPLLILVFIPLFDYLVYPLLERCRIKRPLQKLTFGGILAAIAFVLSALVEVNLEQTYPVIPGPNEAQLRIFNGLPCDYEFVTKLPEHSNFQIKSLNTFEEKHFIVEESTTFEYNAITSNSEICSNLTGIIKLEPETSISYFITKYENQIQLTEYIDSPAKSKTGEPLVRILATIDKQIPLILNGNKNEKILMTNSTELIQIPVDQYKLILNEKIISTIDIKLGGVYVLLIEGQENYTFNHYILTEPNSLHMFWQLPQYIIITAGEVMFSVTGLEFSFTQAPSSMKSVLQACWLLTVAFGNLIVVLIAEFQIFKSQAAEFLLFAILMFADMGIFILLAMRYTYVSSNHENDLCLDSDECSNKDLENVDLKTQHSHANKGFVED